MQGGREFMAKKEKVIDVRGRYSREISEIEHKLKQLEEGRIYEPSQGKHSKMDGSLYTNIIQLREMLYDLIDKIEYNKQSDIERLQEELSKYKI